MKLFNVEELRRELANTSAADAREPLPKQLANSVLVMVKHLAARISVAHATQVKRQESTDLLIDDLDRRLSELERKTNTVP